MPRWAFAAAAVVVFLLVASQVLVPSLVERQVEKRLTENGGRAEVTLGAVPALRLLLGEGERFEVDAAGLDLELDQRSRVFERLEGFSVVDVSIADFETGPLEMDAFELSRDGGSTYRMLATGEASARGLADLGFEALELPGESFLDLILGEFLPDANLAVPIDLDMELSSADGRVQVVSGGGTVAGVPAGSLAQLITAAIVVRL